MALGDRHPVVMESDLGTPAGVATLGGDKILNSDQRPNAGQLLMEDGSTTVQEAIEDAGKGGEAAGVSYDNVTSGLAATDVQAALDELAEAGTGLQMDLLWENASPSSDFAAQTISLAASGYDGVLVTTSHGTCIIFKGDTHVFSLAQTTNFSRNITLTSAGTELRFLDCVSVNSYASSTTTTANSVIRPKRIYGVKGVST